MRLVYGRASTNKDKATGTVCGQRYEIYVDKQRQSKKYIRIYTCVCSCALGTDLFPRPEQTRLISLRNNRSY